jgi:Tfp pilus assembly protein PilF
MIQCAYIINELKEHNLFDDLKGILADAYIYQGKILRQGTKEERDRAKDNFEKALALTPTHLSAQEELDSLMLERGEFPNATIYYTK